MIIPDKVIYMGQVVLFKLCANYLYLEQLFVVMIAKLALLLVTWNHVTGCKSLSLFYASLESSLLLFSHINHKMKESSHRTYSLLIQYL